MFYDPYTLIITPGECNGKAEGTLYLDDETSYAHEEAGMFAVKKLSFNGNELRSSTSKKVMFSINKGSNIVASPKFTAINVFERIVIGGQERSPKRVIAKYPIVSASASSSSSSDSSAVTSAGKGEMTTVDLLFGYDKDNKIIIIKKPGMKAIDDWSISFEF
jgi:hypothetical protein